MKAKDVLILAGFSIPWGFLAFWAGQLMLFGLGMAVMGLLAWLCGRAGKLRLLITGNGVSALLTLLLLCRAYYAGAWQFKIFGPFGWTVLMTVCAGLLQWLIWKKQWKLLALVALLVIAFLGGVFWLLFA